MMRLNFMPRTKTKKRQKNSEVWALNAKRTKQRKKIHTTYYIYSLFDCFCLQQLPSHRRLLSNGFHSSFLSYDIKNRMRLSIETNNIRNDPNSEWEKKNWQLSLWFEKILTLFVIYLFSLLPQTHNRTESIFLIWQRAKRCIFE